MNTERKIIIPVDNLQLHSQDDFQLHNATIVQTQKRHLEDIIAKRFFRLEYQILLNSIEVSPYLIEVNCGTNDESRHLFDKVLIIFKLFKDNVVNSNIYIADGCLYHLPHYFNYVAKSQHVYELSHEKEKTFREFWREFFGIQTNNFAVRRFHLSDFRPFLDDRFVDYVETLEYLFVPDSKKGEITYKFSTRSAMILGREETPEKRKEILEALKEAYGFRSNIVHGVGSGKKFANNRSKKMTLIRQYARDSIIFFYRKGCLDNNEDRRKLIEDLTVLSAQVSIED